MSTTTISDLDAYCEHVAERAKAAAAELAVLSGAAKDAWLQHSADELRGRVTHLLAANQRDLDAAPEFGLTEAQIDRLRLTPARIESLAVGLEEVAALPDPIGEVMEARVRPNGLHVHKVRVPLGVVFFIYESRPNVTADAAAICLKSGNAVILRGGKEAARSSAAIVEILQHVATLHGLPEGAVQLVATADRAAVGHFLQMDSLIDVAIPRGGEGLIRRVASEARMPVIKHFSGNCHVYVDEHVDLQMALTVTLNSKCQRLGVCNAAESLLVHEQVAAPFLSRLGPALAEQGIEVRGDQRTCAIIAAATAQTAADLSCEYLGPVISVNVVPHVEAAIEHINRYGSGHTDAILSKDYDSIRKFTSSVDSSAVIVNASTRFNDGGQFGLGAEIGISTDKFHARGPCGLKELTSYKYVVWGAGQIRS